MSEGAPRAVLRRWTVVGGAWLAIGAFSAGQIYLARRAQGHPPPLGPLLIMELPVWLIWALATPIIVVLARRLRIDRRGAELAWLGHVAAAIAAGTLYAAFRTLWYQAFNPYPLTSGTPVDWFWTIFRQVFILGFVIYWAVLGVHHAVANYARYRERSTAAALASAELAQARLDALTSQLQPHFLFNTLNSISALIAEQPAEARRMVARLSNLLRATLDAGALEEVPLNREVALVEGYLAIEKTRFGDRLAFDLQIPDETRDAAVPGLMLQPLVENGIRHGFGRREEPGWVQVTAARANGSLELHVVDDGDGFRPGAREGIGLGNTRRRLAELYGPDGQVIIRPRPWGGVDVTIRIPFRLTSPADDRGGSGVGGQRA